MLELLLEELGELGEAGAGAALEEDEDDGELLLAPPAALPLLGVDGEVLELELDAPPEAGALGGVAALDELEDLSLFSTDAEPEAEVELEGAVDVEPDGAVVEPAEEDEPGVVRWAVGAPSLSQPVSNPAPSARDTAAARIESLMKASVVGVPSLAARFGPAL